LYGKTESKFVISEQAGIPRGNKSPLEKRLSNLDKENTRFQTHGKYEEQ